MTTHYKKNLIILQYLSFPENTHYHYPYQLNTPHGLFHQPKAHLYIIAVTHLMVVDTMSHPLFLRVA